MTSPTPANPITVALQEAIALDAPLDERMAVIRRAVVAYSEVFTEGVDRFVNRLTAAGAGHNAPAVGDVMPPFFLPDHDGHLVTLSDMLRDGPVVIAFHRGHWCPYCQLHAVALGEVRREVEAAGARIVAITPDMQPYNLKLRAEGGGGIPILSDIDNGYALSLNLAIWVDEEMKGMMRRGGYDTAASQGNTAWFLPIPATFVVAANGRIVARHIDPDYRRRMDIELLLDSVRASRQAA